MVVESACVIKPAESCPFGLCMLLLNVSTQTTRRYESAILAYLHDGVFGDCTLYVCGVSLYPLLSLLPPSLNLYFPSSSLSLCPLPLLLPPPPIVPLTGRMVNEVLSEHLCRLSGSLFSISYISDLLSA